MTVRKYWNPIFIYSLMKQTLKVLLLASWFEFAFIRYMQIFLRYWCFDYSRPEFTKMTHQHQTLKQLFEWFSTILSNINILQYYLCILVFLLLVTFYNIITRTEIERYILEQKIRKIFWIIIMFMSHW